MRNASLGLVLFASGCLQIPLSAETTPPSPSSTSAWVVFALDARPNEFITIRDEEGQMLGRLRGRGWFAVERPPGSQWFFADDGSIRRDDERPGTNVGALAAHLEAGKIYLVQSVVYEGPRQSLRQLWRGGGLVDGCVVADQDEDRRPEYLDLIGVRPGGAEWGRVLRVLRTGLRYSPAPRGFDEPYVDQLPSQGRARIGQCLDEERSELRGEDGFAEWPL